MKNIINSPNFAIIFLCISMALYFSICFICRSLWGTFDIEEIGVTEFSTYLFYGIGAIIISFCAKDFFSDKSKLKSFIAIVFLYITMILRDMGAQHWLTSHDTTVTKIRFFTNPTNPLYEKIIAAVVMLGILAILLYMFLKHIKPFIKGLFKLEPVSWSIFTLFIWTIITQIADRFPAEYLKATGIALTEPITFTLKILEEGGESLLPLLIAIAFLQYHYSKNSTKEY